MEFYKEHSPEYDDYMGSDKWKALRIAEFERVNNICERCRDSFEIRDLEVHHRTYDRLGHEWPSDLKVVCRRCHREEDKDRIFGRWAVRKYGPNWKEQINVPQAWKECKADLRSNEKRGAEELRRIEQEQAESQANGVDDPEWEHALNCQVWTDQ